MTTYLPDVSQGYANHQVLVCDGQPTLYMCQVCLEHLPEEKFIEATKETCASCNSDKRPEPQSDYCEFNDERLPPQFWAKVTVAKDGCWLWREGANSSIFHLKGKPRSAHRYIYSIVVKPLPSDYELQRLCGKNNCVRPDCLNSYMKGTKRTANDHTRRTTGRHTRSEMHGTCPNCQEEYPWYFQDILTRVVECDSCMWGSDGGDLNYKNGASE